MESFQNAYRALYATFGHPLTGGHAIATEVLDAAERRLGARVPAALRDYCLVAGRERRFNTCLNRLLPPARWTIDKQRLVFMEENQCVSWWGVSTRNPDSADPPVSQGLNDEPIAWYPQHRKCSVFLAVMLHYQAVNGGLRSCGQGVAPGRSNAAYQKLGWTFHGEVDSLRAYSRPNQVVCVPPPSDLPFLKPGTILMGGKTKRDLHAIAANLGAALD